MRSRRRKNNNWLEKRKQQREKKTKQPIMAELGHIKEDQRMYADVSECSVI
jgi:hypothetical protein